MKTIISNLNKHFTKIPIFASVVLLIAGCSKDDDSVNAPQENPIVDVLPAYLELAGFSSYTTAKNSVDYEFGHSFIPTADGKIIAISVKIPDIRQNIRITLWDKATRTILRSELMDITSSDVEITKQITDLSLVKDKEYMLTFNTNDWYTRSKKVFTSPAAYPIIVGDIKITGFGSKMTANQEMPNYFVTNYCSGDLSFKFQKN